MKKLLALIVAVAAILSCVKENITTGVSSATEVVTLIAGGPEVTDPMSDSNSSTPQQSAQTTKTQLLDGKTVLWTPGDKIKMCFDVMTWGTNVCTGSVFESLCTESIGSTSFVGNVDISSVQDYGFVAYPSSFKFDSRTSGAYGQDYSTVISYEIPSVQTALEHTFASNLNLSYAPVLKSQIKNQINNKTPISVKFKNMCALLKVNLPSEQYNITEVLVESSSVLTGECSLLWEATYSSQVLKLGSFNSAVNKVRLANESGGILTPGASYYAVIWPGTHSSLTFTFIDKDGKTCIKKLQPSSAINCEPGKVTTINLKSAMEFKDADPELNVSTSTLDYSADGGTSSFTFNTNKDWTITTDSPLWMEISSTSGNASAADVSVDVTCYENTAYQPRTGNITISAGGLAKIIRVTQEAAEKVISLSVSADCISIPGQGGTSSFTVTCNDNWTIADIPDWLTLSKTSGVESSSAVTVDVTVKQNFVYGNRNKSIVVKAGTEVRYVNFSQNGPNSYSKGSQVTKAGDILDGKPYIIECYRNRELYWKWESGNLRYYKWNSGGLHTIKCTFIYHRDDSQGRSGDSNYKSWSTGIWETATSAGEYLDASFKFVNNRSNAKYIANSNCWGTETGTDIDMCEVGKTTSVCYTNTATENGGSYYWGGTGETNRKWLVFNAIPQY